MAVKPAKQGWPCLMGNNCIRKVDTFGNISTVAGNGTAGYSGDGFPATDAQLDSPFAVCTDKYGSLYIADHNNNVVRRVDTNGIIHTFAGIHIAGYSGDGSLAVGARLNAPSGVATDIYGSVYISDANNNAIRMVDSNGRISTLAGNTVAGFGGDLGAPEGATLFNPLGLTVDSFQTLYIADANNQRVRRIYFVTVGVHEVNNNSRVSMFPNPAANTISLSGVENGYTAAVMDARGRLVSDVATAENSNTLSINIAHLPAGVYYMRVADEHNQLALVKSFVKQ
ncbi:MAG: T9SS C-terminal target domain-containing protein [Chitinophagia bacterium]|nr:T9SS C-terminal target domain-containing protein [Chitinophagia bacterium]